MGKMIGIDLRTTNRVFAIMEGSDPEVITNEEGSRVTPSVVAWDERGEVIALERQNDAEIASAIQSLEKESHRIASAMHEPANPKGTAPEPSPKGGNDRVVDAEFEEHPHP